MNPSLKCAKALHAYGIAVTQDEQTLADFIARETGVEALRAERDDLKRALAFTSRLVQDWEQSATAIGAERDAFRANSDRYLWLRDTHGCVHDGDANWPSLVQVAWSRHGPRDEKFPDENKDCEAIDAAIDAAMKGTQ